MSSGATFQVYKLQSTKTGFNPHFITHNAVEIIEKEGTKIAQDGDKDIRTPYDSCLLMMPNHSPGAGVRKLRLCRRS